MMIDSNSIDFDDVFGCEDAAQQVLMYVIKKRVTTTSRFVYKS